MKNDFHRHLLHLGLIVSSCIVGPPLAADTYAKESQYNQELRGLERSIYGNSTSIEWPTDSISSKKQDLQPKLGHDKRDFFFSLDNDSIAHLSAHDYSKARPLSAGNLVAANNQTVPGSLEEDDEHRTILVNFNNINMVEYLRFISRNTNKNFVFDENDLQFNITLISEEPTTIEDIMTALIQELRIHDLSLIEQGNNFIIHKNPKVNGISQVVSGEVENPSSSEIVTQVFRLNTADVEKIAAIIKPLASDYSIIEAIKETNHLIVTDLSTNVAQIAKLLKTIDSPASGLVIGQYVVRTTSTDALIAMAQQIIAPIAQDQTFIMVPWNVSNSIFVVSTPFIVERALSILQHIDQNQKSTKIFDFKQLKYQDAAPAAELPAAGLYINSIPYQLSKEEQEKEEELFKEKERAKNVEKSVQPGWNLSPQGRWEFRLNQRPGQVPTEPPAGTWKVDSQGKWFFDISGGAARPGGPGSPGTSAGSWQRDELGQWFFDVNSTAPSAPGAPNGSAGPGGANIPGGPGGVDIRGRQSEGRFGVLGEPLGIPLGTGQWLDESDVRHRDFSGESFSLTPPKGVWRYDPTEGWHYELERGEAISIERLTRDQPVNMSIPLGSREKSSFSIYKLQYRKGDAIVGALQAIADSLSSIETHSETLIATLTSVQWLETSNSLIFTGFKDDLLKMRQLMAEIDVPLRQVFIEMLILETSVIDALQYSVTWGSRFGGGNWAGSEGFNSVDPGVPSTLNPVLAQTGATNGGLQPAGLSSVGFSYGIIGQSIVNTALGLEFNSLGALFQAIRTKSNLNVILNPKIITEDSVPAEIFVGENIAFKTQSIASGDLNNTITNNFEFRDVGTRLRVTPTLGNNDIITLEIVQEISAVSATQLLTATDTNSNNFPGPNTTKSTTTTRVHLPDGYFLIISGMMRDQVDHNATQIPCVGAIPLVGSFLGKSKEYRDQKRNQMIFIRPKIVQLREEIENITKHNQDIWKAKHEFKQDWLYESERALDFLNLSRSDLIEPDPEFAEYNN